MNLLKKYLKEFDKPDTLLVLSSFPHQGEEIAVRNAISRYSYLLVKNMPKKQKIVVLCERNGHFKPYKLGRNILVVPTYRYHSLTFGRDVFSKVLNFKNAKNLLVQFEFSIFGGKIVIPQLVAVLGAIKLTGKNIKAMVHQVVTDVNTLSGHLGIARESLKSKLLNYVISGFYRSLGVICNKILVHDKTLASRISRFVPARKVEVIPHAVFGSKRFDKDDAVYAKKYFGVPKGYKLVTVYGYRSWYKGTDWIVKNFRKFALENPGTKIKLMVAGGDSPTLGGTASYKRYSESFKRLVKWANGSIICTDFVPESEVEKVFAASDLIVFPYRTKMSASGAFSLALTYGKKYLVSNAFSDNLKETDFLLALKENGVDIKRLIFSLNHVSFIEKMEWLLGSKTYEKKIGHASNAIVDQRTWERIALKYQKVCLQGEGAQAKLSYGFPSYASVK